MTATERERIVTAFHTTAYPMSTMGKAGEKKIEVRGGDLFRDWFAVRSLVTRYHLFEMQGKSSLTVGHGLPTGHEAILEALGDRTRRQIVDRLRAGPLPVVEIARGMSVSRPAVSQHLKVLKLAGLVVDRPESNRRLYALDPNGLAALRVFLESFWQDGLTRLADLADNPGGSRGRD